MLTGIILTALFLAPGQTESGPPQKLPTPMEGARPAGTMPSPAEVALPPSTSGCASCGSSSAGGGCATGNCYGTTCTNEPTGPPIPAWTDTSYLLYNLKAAPLPALLSGPGGVLLNSNSAGFGQVSGGHVAGGRWVNDAHTLGYGYSGFILEQAANFIPGRSDGNGNPLLGRPFIDALTAAPATFLISNPGQLSGSFSAESGVRFAGGELYGIKNVYYCPNKNFNLLAGFRYLDLDEYLVIFQRSSAVAGAAAPTFTVGGQPTPGPISLVDRFRTRNQFWGFEVGARGEYSCGPVSFGVTSKIGVGNNYQTLDIAGQTTAPNVTAATGGLLALSSNIGRSNPTRIALLADVSAEFGLQISEGSKIFVAYDFLYLNDVIRPGAQVDSIINTRFVPASANFGSQSGVTSPIRTRESSDFFAYGFRFGYQLQY